MKTLSTLFVLASAFSVSTTLAARVEEAVMPYRSFEKICEPIVREAVEKIAERDFVRAVGYFDATMKPGERTIHGADKWKTGPVIKAHALFAKESTPYQRPSVSEPEFAAEGRLISHAYAVFSDPSLRNGGSLGFVFEVEASVKFVGDLSNVAVAVVPAGIKSHCVAKIRNVQEIYENSFTRFAPYVSRHDLPMLQQVAENKKN